MSQLCQQRLGRHRELAAVDAVVVDPGLRHVQHHVLIILAGLHVIVVVALRDARAAILHLAAQAPRAAVQRLAFGIGIHSVNIVSTLQTVRAVGGVGIPRQRGGLVELAELSGQRVGHRSRGEGLQTGILLHIVPVVVLGVFQGVDSRHVEVDALGVTHFFRNGDVVGLPVRLLTLQRVVLADNRLILLGKVETYAIDAFVDVYLFVLVFNVVGQGGNGKLQLVGTRTLTLEVSGVEL